MPNKPRFLYFDLGNVLLKFDHEIACRQMAAVAGITPERVREIAIEGELFDGYETGDISGDQYYEMFCEQSGTRADYGDLRLAASEIFELNAPTCALVAQLKSARHRLGILSNTNEAHWEYIRGRGYGVVENCFEIYALSFELRSMKPAQEIYLAAAELAGVSPGEIFFVDDRPENVAGALAAGFDAVQFTTVAALAADLRRRDVQFNF